MCTISWLYSADDYELFFNRDEQRTRALAIPPASFQIDDCELIMPIDPEGGGSWVATNEYGYSVALLNYYQGRLPKGKMRSRGEIVRQLASKSCLEKIAEALDQFALEKYAPFSLLVFAPKAENSDGNTTLWRWTGKQLQKIPAVSPLISSAKYFDQVEAARLALYQEKIAHKANVGAEDYLQLHASHVDGPSAYSFCMHREDACTVSFSHIRVNKDSSLFLYQPGSPCEKHSAHRIELKRRQ